MPPVPTRPDRAELDADEVRRAAHVGEPPGARPARVAVVQRVDVGEQDQRVGVDQVGDQRREPVVVAEADLVGGHGVVLVDDRARCRAPAAGCRVRCALRWCDAAHHVVGGEQHLADPQAVPGEGGGVARDEHALPDRRPRPAGWRGRGAGRAGRAGRGRRRSRRRRPARSACRPPRLAASTSTSASTRSTSIMPCGVVSEDDPTLTTMRAAVRIRSRSGLSRIPRQSLLPEPVARACSQSLLSVPRGPVRATSPSVGCQSKT